MVAWLFDDGLKIDNFSEEIKSFVDRWGWLLVGDLEKVLRYSAKHMGRVFEVS